jgi:uncharacterized membrane protein
MPILIIVFIWLMASLIVYLVIHWQAVLAVLFFGLALGFAWWLSQPVIFEKFHVALVRLFFGLAKLKHRGLTRIAITRTRARRLTPKDGRHAKGYHHSPRS